MATRQRSTRSPRDRRPHRARRHAGGIALLLVAAAALSACGGSSGSATTLNWYINNASQAPLAKACVEQSGGAYQIKIQLLPNQAAGQREQLLRRLAAKDKTVDIMSLDPPFMAEFANAGFMRPFTDQEKAEFSAGVLDGPNTQALYQDTMYSAPFYGNAQLLWYKKSAVQKTGVDPAAGSVTWQQLIDGAVQAGMTIGVQGRRNESLMVWVNALVASAGGSILAPESAGAAAKDVRNTLDSDAGRAAAQIMGDLARSSAAPPALSTAGEEDSRAAFQAGNGAFMVNWPYVWSAFQAAEQSGTLPAGWRDDVGWATYPRVTQDRPSAPPIGGIGLSVGAFSAKPGLAVQAIRCLRSEASQKAYFLAAGDPAASSAVYDDPEVRKRFPMADTIRDSMNAAVPRPISPYYGDVTSVVQRGYHPPDTLSPAVTPRKTASLMNGVLSNKQLL